MGVTATALVRKSPLSLALALAAVIVAPPREVAAQKPPPEGQRLDPTFGNGGRVLTPFGGESTAYLNALARQDDGKLVTTGLHIKGQAWNIPILRYRPDGSLDPTFGAGGVVLTDIDNGSLDEATTIAVQADGKIVVGGTINRSGELGGDIDFMVARYQEDGSLDPSFGGGDGVFTLDLGFPYEDVMSLAVQPDGRIVTAGYVNTADDANAQLALLRLLPDGSLDPAFGNGGIVLTDFTPPGSSRFTSDGATAMRLQSDGKIVVGGNTWGGAARTQTFIFARYAADGSLDPTFGVGGKVVHRFTSAFLYLHAIALHPDGGIVASGVRVWNWESSWVITRYRPDGMPDAGFGRAGVVELPYKGRAETLALQEDKGIFVAGSSGLRTGAGDFALARLTPAGAVDTTFGHGSAPVLTDFADSFDAARAIAIQPDGRVILAGSASVEPARAAPALARYVVGSATP